MNLLECFNEMLKADRKEFAFIKQGGNQGDQLIYTGAEKLADHLKIKYQTYHCFPPPDKPHRLTFPEDTIIYMHGGGGFNKWWGWSPKLIRYLRDKNPKNTIIVGPSTFDIDQMMLDDLPRDVIYFAREFTSYNFLTQRLTYVHHSPDTALYLRYGDGYLDKHLNYQKKRSTHTLLAIRGDIENAELPASINPSEYTHRVDPCVTNNWASLHLDASKIVTNRCHSAILGALLEKPTYIFAGKYHKNRSLWKYCLKEMGVQWIE